MNRIVDGGTLRRAGSEPHTRWVVRSTLHDRTTLFTANEKQSDQQVSDMDNQPPRNDTMSRTAEVIYALGTVAEIGREPAFDIGDFHLLALRVVFDLVAGDLADAEVVGLRVGKVPAAHG